MFIANSITPKIIYLEFNRQVEMAETMLRFQEHYESPIYSGVFFTVSEFKDWYKDEYGDFTYFTDWSGFNFPSKILKPFYDGKFDPLSEKEVSLLNFFKPRRDDFYIISSAGGEGVFEHEMCHALFSTEPDYREKVLNTMGPYDLDDARSYLKKSYHPSVIDDELNAYICADWEFILEETGIDIPKELHLELRKIKGEHEPQGRGD